MAMRVYPLPPYGQRNLSSNLVRWAAALHVRLVTYEELYTDTATLFDITDGQITLFVNLAHYLGEHKAAISLMSMTRLHGSSDTVKHRSEGRPEGPLDFGVWARCDFSMFRWLEAGTNEGRPVRLFPQPWEQANMDAQQGED